MAKTQFTHYRLIVSPKRILGVIIALVAAFLLLISVINVAQKYFTIRKHISELSLEQQTLMQKHKSLSKMNAFMTTLEGQEQMLRNKYNVVKPGEGVIIVDPQPVISPPPHSRSARWWNAVQAGLGINNKK
jgi:cell division protein FtsB